MRVRFGLGGALLRLAPALAALGLSACASKDYSDLESYYAHEPRTVIVLPVLNESTEAEASGYFLATVARPLVERGYYVLPVEPTMEVLAREGIFDAGLARQIETHRLAEHLGADAVLYVTIEKWDTSYVVIASSVTVTLRYELVDARTGEVLWSQRSVAQERSNSGGGGGGLGGLIAAVVVSTVDAALTAALTDYVPLASQANFRAFGTIPPGRDHPGYAELQTTIREWRAEKDAAEAAGSDGRADAAGGVEPGVK